LEIGGTVSSVSQWKYIKCISFQWLPVEAAPLNFNISFIFLGSFWEGIDKDKGIVTSADLLAF
jgi:hypothetical protein